MSQGALPGTPSPKLDSILATAVQRLDQIDILSSTILPVEFTDLGFTMEKVQTTFTASTASSVDFANAIRWNADLVDLIFGERLASVIRAPELAAIGALVDTMNTGWHSIDTPL